MPRPKRIRKVIDPPGYKGYMPIGVTIEKPPIIMNFEEYEAIRLSDFEMLGHVEASIIMEVSRPTYTRIYESARRKVAMAFVTGSPILFEGGKVFFNSEWYKCANCECWFNHPEKDKPITGCALCNSPNFKQFNNNDSPDLEDLCYCSRCGYEKEHIPNSPCQLELCPQCNTRMNRKGLHARRRNQNY
jgi:uncharacterized protein